MILAEVPQVELGGVVITGVPYALPYVLDTRLALLRDTPIAIPTGLFGYAWQSLTTAGKSAPLQGAFAWSDPLRVLLQDVVQAAFLAREAESRRWEKIFSPDQLRSLAESARLRVEAGAIDRLGKLIDLAQRGESISPGWKCSTLQMQPILDCIAASVRCTSNRSLQDDLEDLKGVAESMAFLSYLTRLPSIVPAYPSSSSELGSMTRRAATLKRFAALLGVLAVQGYVVRVALLKVLLTSPFFLYTHLDQYHKGEIEKAIAAADRLLSFDVTGWEARFRTTLGPVTCSHLGKAVENYRLPRGMHHWFEEKTGAVDVRFAKGLNRSRFNVGDSFVAEALNASTTANPLLMAAGVMKPEEWIAAGKEMARAILDAIVVLTTRFNQDELFTLSLLEEGTETDAAVAEAKKALAWNIPVHSPFVPASSAELAPISTRPFESDSPISTIPDVIETALVPYYLGNHDIRDIARFVKLRASSVGRRVRGLASSIYALGNDEWMPVVLAAEVSPMHQQWTFYPVPFAYWELMPDALLGTMPNVKTAGLDVDGLTAVLGVTVSAFYEQNESVLQGDVLRPQSSVEPVVAMALSLARIGALTYDENPSTKGEADILKNLKKQGLEERSVTEASRGFVRAHLWGAWADKKSGGKASTGGVEAQAFANTEEAVPLTRDRKWLLWPYTWIPVPGPLQDKECVFAPLAEPVQYGAGSVFLPAWAMHRPLIAKDGWIRVREFARVKGLDSRSLTFVSYPAGLYPSSAVVMNFTKKTFRSPAGVDYIMLEPKRVDFLDALLTTSDVPPNLTSKVMLIARPGRGSSEMPPAATVTLAAFKAEPLQAF